MIKFLIISFSLLVVAFLYYLFIRRPKRVHRKIEVVKDMATWMQMSREERNKFGAKEQRESMQRKKTLLNQIRKEYKAISKLNASKGRPPFIPTK